MPEMSKRALVRGRVVLALAIGLEGCGPLNARSSTYAISVQARTDDAAPLPGAVINVGGQQAGVTDGTGKLVLSLAGEEGQPVGMEVVCPTGFSGPTNQPQLLLKRVESLESEAVAPIEVEVECVARERYAVIAVRTGRAGIPIKLRGQAVTTTSASGTAHVLLKEPPGSDFNLTLDTTALADLRPQSPSRQFSVSGRDAFVVWDQSFELVVKKPEPRKRRKREPAPEPPPPRVIPQRL